MSEHSETGRSESDSLFQGSMRTIGQVIESLREPLKLPRRSSAPATAATDIAEAGARRTPLADDKLPNDDEDDDESAPRYAQPPWCQDEDLRLETLRRLQIMDSAAESSFDNLVELAGELCEMPIALVTLLDRKRQWFKAKRGLDVDETPRSQSFCGHAIADQAAVERGDMFVVPDALEDERFRENPLVQGAPDIRFYAGQPLCASNGQPLGTLCVIDRKPRVLSPHQKQLLKLLAKQVEAELELRFVTQTLMREHNLTTVLLNSALPRHIVKKLTTSPELPIAQHHKSAAVMFVDLVGFTTFSSERSSSEVVGVLSEIFGAFDHITTMCGLLKIKTLGDGYMVAGKYVTAGGDAAVRDVRGSPADSIVSPEEVFASVQKKAEASGEAASDKADNTAKNRSSGKDGVARSSGDAAPQPNQRETAAASPKKENGKRDGATAGAKNSASRSGAPARGDKHAQKKERMERKKSTGCASKQSAANEDILDRCMRAAAFFIEALLRYDELRGVALRARIGLNIGPVVSGVIGSSQLTFDIWGDTVNVASRLEGVAEPSTVCVTRSAYKYLSGRYKTRSLGKRAVKGKGEMPLWIVSLPPLTASDLAMLDEGVSDPETRRPSTDWVAQATTSTDDDDSSLVDDDDNGETVTRPKSD